MKKILYRLLTAYQIFLEIIGKVNCKKPKKGLIKVLCFHNISETDDDFSISEQNFIKIIKTLKGKWISLEACRNHNGVGYVLSFDDGYESLYSIAYPILKKEQIPFVAYITTDYLEREGYLTIDELKEISEDEICVVGSHMCSHSKTREMSKKQIEGEWSTSKIQLESIIGRKVNHAALPYGSVVACSKRSINQAFVCGYSTVSTTVAMPYNGKKIIPRYVYQNSKDFLKTLICDT